MRKSKPAHEVLLRKPKQGEEIQRPYCTHDIYDELTTPDVIVMMTSENELKEIPSFHGWVC